MNECLRYLPSINNVKDDPRFQILINEKLDERYAVSLVKKIVQQLRQEFLNGKYSTSASTKAFYRELVLDRLEKQVEKLTDLPLKPVINATGVVLHTNMGRARLSESAISAMGMVGRNYSNLEFNLNSGKRGSRHDHVETLLTLISGAEAGMVVNNNAAAVYLILRALGKNQEVIVSRGELVEIGGSFRVSSIMEESDAIMKEVGTTNKTHKSDYFKAINDNTAMIMKVHRSNFNITGFTASVNRQELIETARNHDIFYYEDLGSGAFYDYAGHGVGDEPLVETIIQDNPDVISCSGDKLFGGPQAGIILGKKNVINQLKKHQLARVFRVDKATLAALASSLQDYLRLTDVKHQNPTVKAITDDLKTVEAKAYRLVSHLTDHSHLLAETIPVKSTVGGGTMPEVELDSVAVCLNYQHLTAEQASNLLRQGNPAIVGRIEKDQLLLDMRTVEDGEIEILAEACRLI